MLQIDIVRLKNTIVSLDKLINEYELIKLNMFNQLKDACINWQDGDSKIFEDKIYQEKEETELIIQFLYEKKEILKFIYDRYHDIGNKIACNLESKNGLIRSFNYCENQINNIIYNFNKIDTDFYYDERYFVISQKRQILNLKNQILEIKKIILNKYNKLEEIEREVKNKLTNLENIKISTFDFSIGGSKYE